MKRRVAITGIGLLTPLGIGLEQNLQSLQQGKSGIRRITQFDCSKFASQIAGEVKAFDPTLWMTSRDAKTMDRFLQLAIAAGASALEDSHLPSRFHDETAERVGCYVGAGWGGLATMQKNYENFLAKGPKFGFSPYLVSASIINLAPGQLAIRHNIQGPSLSHVSACATGAHCIGEAARAIQWNVCDVMVTGGVESAIVELALGGFGAIRALSTKNEIPEAASRPFDRDPSAFPTPKRHSTLY